MNKSCTFDSVEAATVNQKSATHLLCGQKLEKFNPKIVMDPVVELVLMDESSFYSILIGSMR